MMDQNVMLSNPQELQVQHLKLWLGDIIDKMSFCKSRGFALDHKHWFLESLRVTSLLRDAESRLRSAS